LVCVKIIFQYVVYHQIYCKLLCQVFFLKKTELFHKACCLNA
jgi:hypothetical protein